MEAGICRLFAGISCADELIQLQYYDLMIIHENKILMKFEDRLTEVISAANKKNEAYESVILRQQNEYVKSIKH